MFAPLLEKTHGYTLMSNGVIVTRDEHQNIIDIWHGNRGDQGIVLISKANGFWPVQAELTLEQVAEAAANVAKTLSRSLDLGAPLNLEAALQEAHTRVAVGGKAGTSWAKAPTQHGLPVTPFNLEVICEAAKAMNVTDDQRYLLIALLFGEYVHPSVLV